MKKKEKKDGARKDSEIREDHFRTHPFHLSIRYKLALPVLVLVLVLVSLVLYTTYNVVSDLMIKHKEARLHTIAEIFSETLKIPLESDDAETLGKYVRLLAEQADVEEVRVEDASGRLIGASRTGRRPLPEVLWKRDFLGVKRIYPNVYAAVALIRKGDESLGRLIIIFSKVEFEQDLQKIFQEKFFVAFILTLAMTLVIAGITWLVLRPLIALQQTARNILSGDLEARANIHSWDEIQEVGEAFNKVVSRLVQSFEHLRVRTLALEESEEKYRSIVNEVSDIIFSITPEGELILLNRGFSGYSRDEILAEGLPLFLLMHAPGEAQKFQEALETIVRTKQPILHLGTQHHHRLHHNEIYYQTNLTPVVDYEGNLRLIQGVMRDVTDLRRVEMMKETLIRDVAHELKTPTAKFIMMIQWLKKQFEDHPEKERFSPMVHLLSENADRLMRTISSIMDLSKIESGMSDIQKQEVDLNGVLHLVAEDARPLAGLHNLKIETVLSPNPLRMLGDPDMLYRVFTNLVSNAIKFTSEGLITIRSDLRGNDLYAEVRDTGIGIEPENLEKVFEAFFQKTSATLGIGVGLTISKEIVTLHDGEIWAESDGLGKGSVFKVVFPACQPTSHPSF